MDNISAIKSAVRYVLSRLNPDKFSTHDKQVISDAIVAAIEAYDKQKKD